MCVFDLSVSLHGTFTFYSLLNKCQDLLSASLLWFLMKSVVIMMMVTSQLTVWGTSWNVCCFASNLPSSSVTGKSLTHKKPRPEEVAPRWYSVMILMFGVRGVWPRVPTQLLPGSVALECLLTCRSLHLIVWCGNNNHDSTMRLLRIKKLQEGKTHSKC